MFPRIAQEALEQPQQIVRIDVVLHLLQLLRGDGESVVHMGITSCINSARSSADARRVGLLVRYCTCIGEGIGWTSCYTRI